MSIDNVHRILVVGSGAMGSQIGMLCALAGYDTVVQDIDPEGAASGRDPAAHPAGPQRREGPDDPASRSTPRSRS